jgi:hypothetical protein
VYKKAAVVLFLLMAFISVTASAKGRTVKVVIAGGHLAHPIVLAEDTVKQFGVWAGAGVTIDGVPQTSGFIIDWSQGAIEPPKEGLARYTVSFYAGCKVGQDFGCNTETPLLSYVVVYAHEPSAGKGYVYLPGKNEEWYSLNIQSIFRKLEGQWFQATPEWERIVNPLIEDGPNAYSNSERL